jgi:hypothetical protein
MKAVKTVSGVVTRPVHAAASVAGRAIGLSLGATRAGIRTTGRVVEWAADRGMSTPEDTPATPAPATTTTPVARPTPPGKKPARAKSTKSSVPTPAEVKPAIDRSAPLEVEPLEDDGPEEVLTASGIPAAGVGVNPATGQPNRYDAEPEPLLDPGTAKAVRKETEVLRRGAKDEPGGKNG